MQGSVAEHAAKNKHAKPQLKNTAWLDLGSEFTLFG